MGLLTECCRVDAPRVIVSYPASGAPREDPRKTCGEVAGFGSEVRLLACKKKFQEEETTVTSMFSSYSLCSKTVGYAALLLLSIPVFGQDCVILKRMGPGDQITSHMYSFGIRGKQFQFVQGEMPKGVKWHGRLTDNDVRKLQDAGAKIVILEPKFSATDLGEARKGCTTAPVRAVSNR